MPLRRRWDGDSGEFRRSTRVLVVDDDRADYLLIRSALQGTAPGGFTFDLAASYEAGLAALGRGEHDVCLLDHRLGGRSGLELLCEATKSGCTVPIVMITGVTDEEVDAAAIDAGAADFVARDEMTGAMLARVIHHARERVRHLAQLRRRGQWYRALVEHLTDGVQVLDREGRITFLSPSVTPMLGWTAEELQGSCAFDLVHPGDVTRAREKLAEALENPHAPVRVELRIRHRDGSFRAIEQVTVNHLDEPAVRGLVGTLRDVSERKVAEQAAAKRERLHAALAELGRQALASENVDEMLSLAATAVAEALEVELVGIFERRPDGETFRLRAGVGWHERALGTAEVHLAAGPRVGEALRSGAPVAILDSDTEPCFERSPLFLEHGAAGGVCATIPGRRGAFGILGTYYREQRELSEAETYFLQSVAHLLASAIGRAEVEAALREARDTMGTLIDASPLAIITLDRHGHVLSWNHAAEKIFGWPAEEALGKRNPIVSEDSVGESLELLGRVIGGESLEGVELQRRHRDGSAIDISVYAAPLHCPDNQVQGVMVLAADITHHRSLETQLAMAQKMEAVGQLAGGIAHDFNNLLTAILGPAELALLALPPELRGVREELEEIRSAALRASELTKQLLAFGRRQVVQTRPLDLGEVLEGMERMLRRLIGEHVELRVERSNGAGTVLADLGQIEQVVLNLALNAQDAMPESGQLTIETAPVETAEGGPGHPPGLPPGSYVLLAVTDTGVGMAPETLARIFEPFFTTRDHGTGLGLPTVYSIVQQSGGHIFATSELGQGARFAIYFPRVEAPVGPRQGPSGRPAARGSHTVLVVEDDDSVRAVTERVLRSYGYRVLSATSGPEALLLAETSGRAIDLLVTDVIMPGMSGRELAQRLSARLPGLEILFVSGYTDDTVVRHGIFEGKVPFLQKPFTPETLARKVQEVLQQPRQAGGS